MGGKQNRTKNNMRPSNSSRSAAMVHANLGQFQPFSGNNTTAAAVMPFVFNPPDDSELSIDNNIQLILKKVSKKDCTTKLKGLQEFSELLQQADAAVIKPLLPIWPRFYNLLAIHPDSRIREATQNAHRIILSKAKREIAPYLKQFMAPWYMSQYDNYARAGTVAKEAFKETFSPEKFKEAVNFCHNEILNYVYDNLLVQDADSIASNQFSAQEAEERYERIVISCLRGFAMYLKEVNEAKVKEALPLNTQIIASKKFWKLSASPVPLIRASWFQLMAAILQGPNYLLKGKEAQCLTTILSRLEDEGPMVLPNVWECLLLATSNPDWWKCVNFDQNFAPKIFTVLKQGGFRNANLIFPNLLPLLSNLPLSDEKRRRRFYQAFFDNMLIGLKLKAVNGNSSQTAAVTKAYIECLQLLVQKSNNDTEISELIVNHFTNLIQWTLAPEAIFYKVIMEESSKLLIFLKSNNQNTLLDSLFEKLLNIFALNFKEPTVANKQVEFFLAATSLEGHIEKFVLEICQNYLRSVETEETKELIKPLYTLAKYFNKSAIFLSLLERSTTESFIGIYNDFFKKWLQSDATRCEDVVDLVFLLFDHLHGEDKIAILQDLSQDSESAIVIWTLRKAMEHVEDPTIRSWLQTTSVANILIKIVDKYIKNQCSLEEISLFKSILEQELLITQETLEKITETLSNALMRPNEETSLPSVCSLVSDTCRCAYAYNKRACADNLLLALFDLSCKSPDYDSMSDWCGDLATQLRTLEEPEQRELIQKFFIVVQRNVETALIGRKRDLLDRLSGKIANLVQLIDETKPVLLNWLLDFVGKRMAPSNGDLEALCKMALFVKGETIEILEVPNSVDEICYFTWSFVFARSLSASFRILQESYQDVLGAEQITRLIYCETVAHMFLEHFNNVRYYSELFHCLELIQEDLGYLLSNVSESLSKQLTEFVKERRSEKDLFWLRCARLSFDLELKSDKSETEEDLARLMADVEDSRREELSKLLLGEGELSWQQAEEIISSIHKYQALIKNGEITRHHWDSVLISLDFWADKTLKGKRLVNNYQYQALMVSIAQLYVTILDAVRKWKVEQINSGYVDEWEDVLHEDIHNYIFQMWVFLAEHFSKPTDNPLLSLPLLQSFGVVTDYLDPKLIVKSPENGLKWIKFCHKELLTNSKVILQLWGHKLLSVLVPRLVLLDDDTVNLSSHGQQKSGLVFEQFEEKLLEIQEIVDSVLAEFRVGENSCRLEPTYDSFTYTLAYLTLWNVIVKLSKEATADLQFQYYNRLKDDVLLPTFLTNLFKLMPAEVLKQEETKSKSLVEAAFSHNQLDGSACLSSYCGGDMIENLACYFFKAMVERFPVLVRNWWSVLDIRTAQIVEKVTVSYVSPLICNAELDNVLEQQNTFKNLRVKVIPTVREIQAVYSIDETQMELSISLPANYPLGSPNIACEKQIGGANQKQWLLKFQKCLLHQNGTIWDGLSIWNASLDKKFEGVEECYICYTILHSGTYQMPKLCCRTCKKKFHSACLYKWFSTSNKSSCPICRNLF